MDEKELYRFWTEYGDLQTTSRLVELAKNIDKVEFLEYILKEVTAQTDHLMKFTKHHRLTKILEVIYREGSQIPDEPPSPIQCRKGCSFCCNINVSMTEIEAQIIQEYCEVKGININWQRFRDQKKLNQDTHTLSEHRACAFLKNNECSIYDVRPFNCRNHFALTPAFMCDNDTNRGGQVSSYVNVQKEMVHSAFINVLRRLGINTESDSMARIFLKLKNSKHYDNQRKIS